MAIEIGVFPMKNGDFHSYGSLPEGKSDYSSCLKLIFIDFQLLYSYPQQNPLQLGAQNKASRKLLFSLLTS